MSAIKNRQGAIAAASPGESAMRVTKEQAAKNRETILQTASKMFRERGIDGVGIAELAKSAGLTHGGLYSHFDSKDALVAEVCEHTMARSVERWTKLAEEHPDDPLAAISANYLSRAHVESAGEGCLLAALSADVSRQGPETRRALTEGVRRLLEILERHAGTGSVKGDRQWARARMAALVGAVTLARAVEDPVLSDGFLKAVSNAAGHPNRS